MKRKKIFAAGLVMALIFCGCGSTKEANEVTVGENQRVAYAVVASIEGNEMTYREVDESMAEFHEGMEESTEMDGKDGALPKMRKQGEEGTDSKEGSDKAGEKRERLGKGSGEAGERPEKGSDEIGERPEKGSSEAGERPQMESDETGEKGDRPGMKNKESVTVQIPVGVTVHTANGTDTTFSGIASGDTLKLLLEADNNGNETIVEIWMLK